MMEPEYWLHNLVAVGPRVSPLAPVAFNLFICKMGIRYLLSKLVVKVKWVDNSFKARTTGRASHSVSFYYYSIQNAVLTLVSTRRKQNPVPIRGDGGRHTQMQRRNQSRKKPD